MSATCCCSPSLPLGSGKLRGPPGLWGCCCAPGAGSCGVWGAEGFGVQAARPWMEGGFGEAAGPGLSPWGPVAVGTILELWPCPGTAGGTGVGWGRSWGCAGMCQVPGAGGPWGLGVPVASPPGSRAARPHPALLGGGRAILGDTPEPWPGARRTPTASPGCAGQPWLALLPSSPPARTATPSWPRPGRSGPPPCPQPRRAPRGERRGKPAMKSGQKTSASACL